MSAPPLFSITHDGGCLVISVPHAGTHIPSDIAAALTPVGRGVIDTDWHVDLLYRFAEEFDATIIAATHARTVVDLNRPPDGALLYPGQAETGICPTETFQGTPLYDSNPPDASARAQRVETYWAPYHAALASALDRARARHGCARLLDAHSIRSRVPRLFEGTLPDLNFGTNDGAACTPALAARVLRSTAEAGFSRVLNGRFKGGYITRHYGRPADYVDAIQLELAQSTYMDEQAAFDAPPFDPPVFDPGRAARLAGVLHRMVAELSRL